VWLLGRMLGWSVVLPIAKRTLPLPRLVRLIYPRTSAARRDPGREAAIGALSAWVFKTRPPGGRDNCLERGLVAYRYLSHAGADPSLVIGVATGPGGAHGHVWVTVDERAVHDLPSTLASFEPVLVFGRHGTLVLGERPGSSRSIDSPGETPEGKR
jgi:hypothetical protein